MSWRRPQATLVTTTKKELPPPTLVTLHGSMCSKARMLVADPKQRGTMREAPALPGTAWNGRTTSFPIVYKAHGSTATFSAGMCAVKRHQHLRKLCGSMGKVEHVARGEVISEQEFAYGVFSFGGSGGCSAVSVSQKRWHTPLKNPKGQCDRTAVTPVECDLVESVDCSMFLLRAGVLGRAHTSSKPLENTANTVQHFKNCSGT